MKKWFAVVLVVATILLYPWHTANAIRDEAGGWQIIEVGPPEHKHAILLNSQTGETWVLLQKGSPDGTLAWVPIEKGKPGK